MTQPVTQPVTQIVKRAALAVLGAVALVGTAQAQRESAVTGAKLAELCAKKEPAAQAACDAYIDGISDAVSVYQSLRPRDGSKGPPLPASAYICVPSGQAGTQLRETWLAWAKGHSGEMNRHAPGLVLRALRDTHPCPAAAAPDGAAGGGAPKR